MAAVQEGVPVGWRYYPKFLLLLLAIQLQEDVQSPFLLREDHCLALVQPEARVLAVQEQGLMH